MKSIEEILKKTESNLNTIFEHPYEVGDLTEYESLINSILYVIFDTKDNHCKATIIDNLSAKIEVFYNDIVFSVKIIYNRLPCYFDFEPIIALLNSAIEFTQIGKTKYFTWAYETYILLVNKNEYNELMENDHIYIPHDTELFEESNRKYYKYVELERNPKVTIETIG